MLIWGCLESVNSHLVMGIHILYVVAPPADVFTVQHCVLYFILLCLTGAVSLFGFSKGASSKGEIVSSAQLWSGFTHLS